MPVWLMGVALASAAGAAEVRAPGPGAVLTWMPVTIEVAFDAAADTGSFEVALNGNDITASFAFAAPAGGEIVATATDVWGGFVLPGANSIAGSIDVAGSPEPFSSGFDTQGDPYADAVVVYTQGVNGGYNAGALPTVALGPPSGGGLFIGSLDVVALGRSGSIVLRFDDNVIVDGPGPDFTVFENAFLELGAGSITQPPYAEPGRVSVSQDGISWVEFSCTLDLAAGPYWPGCAGVQPVFADDTLATPHPSIPTTAPIEDLVGLHVLSVVAPPGAGGDAFDLADVGLGWVRYVRVEAAAFDSGTGIGQAAFDLDAIAAVHSAPEIPAGVAVPAASGALRIALALSFGALAALRLRLRRRL